MKRKKSTMGQIVVIFISVLIIAVITGVTFLFVGSLKDETADLTKKAYTVRNETGNINTTGYTLATESSTTCVNSREYSITSAYNVTNQSSPVLIGSGNYSVNSETGLVSNASTSSYPNVNFTYTHTCIPSGSYGAYVGVNTTEGAGLTVTNFLTILFLALIFSAILTVVLRFVLPFINVGKNLDGF